MNSYLDRSMEIYSSVDPLKRIVRKKLDEDA